MNNDYKKLEKRIKVSRYINIYMKNEQRVRKMVAEEKKPDLPGEEVIIDLSNVPLVPTSKKEIQQLEMALIIATLYSPEVLELIRDPVERATWVDSLAVAAAALARQKAGYSIRQIADEVGRSETMIRAHLSGKTKAGKLVLQTYNKLKSGELKIVVPFIKIPKEMAAKIESLEKELESVRREYEEKVKKLEEEIKKLKEENENLKKLLEEKTNIINQVKEKIAVLKELIELVEKIQ